MEQFDLVNEQDQVIGTTNNQEAHSKSLIHRVAAVFVFSPDGRLYVQKRKFDGNILDHSVGGHVQKGESYDQAAQREAAEELGVTDPLTFLTTFYSLEELRHPPYKHFFGLYEVTPNPSWVFKPTEEVEEIVLMSISEIVQLMNEDQMRFTAGFINTMREYLKIKNLPNLLKL